MDEFRLYIAGSSANSLAAIKNITELLESERPKGFYLQVLDLFDHLESATLDKVIATPTLVRIKPQPKKRLIGNFSELQYVKLMLGM